MQVMFRTHSRAAIPRIYQQQQEAIDRLHEARNFLRERYPQAIAQAIEKRRILSEIVEPCITLSDFFRTLSNLVELSRIIARNAEKLFFYRQRVKKEAATPTSKKM